VAVGSARFAESTFYGAHKKGRQTIHLQALSDPSSDLLTSETIVENNQHYSILFTGNRTGLGLRADIYLDAPPEIPSGKSALKIVNGLVGASSIQVFDAQGTDVAPATQFARAGDYVLVSAGPSTLNVGRAGSPSVISSAAYDLAPGEAYTLFVTGEVDYFVTARLLQD
jgi:hypothetical protein